MNIVVETLFFSDEACAQITKGARVEQFKNTKHLFYEKCIFKTTRIESVLPAKKFPGHVEIKTYSKEVYTLKISMNDYCRLIDHIDARAIICKLNN